MPSFSVNDSTTFDGTPFGVSRTINGIYPVKVVRDSVPVALTGQLTTRTDNDTGVITFTGVNPGLIVGDRVDVYWDTGGGGTRRGMLVSSIAGAGPWTVTLGTGAGDVGLGDNLPAATDPVTVMKCLSQEFNVTGNNVKALAAFCEGKGIIVVVSGAEAELWSAVFKSGSGAKRWDNLDGTTNPLAGVTPAKVYMSHGDGATVRGIRFGALE